MSAEMIAGRRFAQSWRGYDTEEVKQFLSQVAGQVRTLRERCEQAEHARREAEQRASHPELDEAVLMSAVGEETASILRSAHGAAAEITSKADAKAQAIVSAAEAKAAQLESEAESLLAARSAEADEVANELREQALAEADQVRELAQQQAKAVTDDATSNAEHVVQEAQALRERILTDLARRRKLGSVQVEQLRAGRDRLLDAYMTVRRTLDEVTDELQRADAEARAAADAVGRQHGLDAEDLVDLRADDASTPQPAAPVAAQKTAAGKKASATARASEAPAAAASPEPGDSPTPAGAPGNVGAPAAAAAPAPATAPVPATAPAPGTAPAPAATPPAATPPAATPPAAAAAAALVTGAQLQVPGHQVTAPARLQPMEHDGLGLGAGASAVVAQPDAIESVRVLRPEPAAKSGPVAPEDKIPAPTNGEPPQAESPVPPLGQTSPNGHPDASSTASRDVQGLFARIRAGRAEATTNARTALYGPPEGTEEAQGAPTGGPSEPEPPERARAERSRAESGPAARAPDERALGELVPAGVVVAEGRASAGVGSEGDFVAKRDQVTARLENSLARKLKRSLQDEQNSLLDRLRNLKGPLTPANVLPSAEEQPDRFVEAGRSVLEDAARAGSQLVRDLYGPPGEAAPLDADVIEDLAEELGRVITQPLRQRLETALQSPSEDAAEVADSLAPAYREWKTQRIEAIARDQVAAAFSRGTFVAYAPGTLLRWVANGSEGPCPDCEDNALAGEQQKGEVWPTGQLYPPAHPGCRCSLQPEGIAGAVTPATSEPATAGPPG